MTTEKEIKHAAYSRYCNDSSVTFNLQCNSFTDGAKWALSQPQIIEIFGKRVKIVEDKEIHYVCKHCCFDMECRKIKGLFKDSMICKDINKKVNRHFVEVDENGNEIKQ